MSEVDLHSLIVGGLFCLAAGVFVFSLFVPAPYGRYARPWWSGPDLPAWSAWLLMELPMPLVFAFFWWQAPRRFDTPSLIFVGLWMAHYTYRCLIYPFLTRSRGMALSVVLLGMGLNATFGWANARWLFELGPARGTDWLSDPRFILGALLAVGGWLLCFHSDLILRRLRGPGETGYRIPVGGGFHFVTAPNYLGEIIMWLGWACLSWSTAGLAIAAVSAANLLPRALRNHRWYKARFADYPPERRALIPWLL